MMIHYNYIGCDIAMAALDIFDARLGRLYRVDNEPLALRAFAQGLSADDFIVFEATGSHDRNLRQALSEANISYARLNPTTVRRFAQARGKRAKTDQIDARTLSQMGAMFALNADAPFDENRERLTALACRRDQLVELRAVQLRQSSGVEEPLVDDDIASLITELTGRIKSIDALIADQLKTVGDLAAQAARLTSAPGVGPVTALTLIAHMPELGHISPKAIASLAGLAPYNNDSGTKQGKRSIRGGRSRVRRALYMAALGAIRACTRFKTFYTAIAQRSGSKKLAIIATARKLLTVLNAMQRTNQNFA